ncbi:LIM domain-containing protein WLIM2b [Ricinus communis]|jgi:cysteine/glycine-rich protein|uniref:Pollen-specific protein SF3, putative n=1 Tax=Ricinus communis TaxID=3988 RepID=B9RC84_RICCO|nr:LIM domain-containing protein WLIM2b [Ricinus communis]EEF51155.1 Pollen-specific protein SF3, putative [Ricinus communis]|eukprot:XP_002509768.1 LIM domain-containing protein WLIM2b [Ricinus communis]
MGFSGTTEKCKACDKTVHFIEMITADGISYHKTCFKCSHCDGRLVMSSYSSMEGVLYCKPHFEQLFRETGSFGKKFPSSVEKKNGLVKTPSKLSSLFSGTQDKCAKCKKTAYPLEKLSVEGEFYHKSCFRCSHGGCYLTPSTYAALDGFIYCKPHFAQLFKEKGSYSYLTKSASVKKNIQNTAEEKTEEGEETKAAETEAEPETEEAAAVAQEQS